MIAGALLLAFSGCSDAWRATRYNIPNLDDYKLFPYETVHKGDQSVPLFDATHEGIPPIEEWAMGEHYKPGMTDMEFFDATKTKAFLVLRNDTLIYEKYVEGFEETSIFTTFSLAKAYVATLMGIAIYEGTIESVEVPVSKYIPHFAKDTSLAKLKIRHLLQMTSGVKANESFINPWGSMSQIYYGEHLDRIIAKAHSQRDPGLIYKYQNINTQILGTVLTRATGKTLAEYLEEKIWIPMGMEAEATWSKDREDGQIKAFCCINARARDFARFGLLYLNRGKWNGKQLIPSDWICEETCLDTTDHARQDYQYHWFTTAEQIDFWGEGLYGQFTYVSPSTNTVIIRLGGGIPYNTPWREIYRNIAGIGEKPVRVEMSKSDLKALTGKYEFGVNNFGDSSLVGETARIKYKKQALKVKYRYGKNFPIYPMGQDQFYTEKRKNVGIRRLTFHRDVKKEGSGITWYRDGNQWELKRVTPKEP